MLEQGRETPVALGRPQVPNSPRPDRPPLVARSEAKASATGAMDCRPLAESDKNFWCPLATVVGRSDKAVVALRHVTAYCGSRTSATAYRFVDIAPEYELSRSAPVARSDALGPAISASGALPCSGSRRGG